MSNELKPCPFCGAAPVVENGAGHETYITCKTPGCAGEDLYVAEARAWNRRAPAVPNGSVENAIRTAMNAAYERAAELCEQRAVTDYTHAAMARQCALDIRSQKNDTPFPDSGNAGSSTAVKEQGNGN
jgi:hypothetical protein